MRIIATDVEYTLTMLFANFITNETAIPEAAWFAIITATRNVYPWKYPRRATAS